MNPRGVRGGRPVRPSRGPSLPTPTRPRLLALGSVALAAVAALGTAVAAASIAAVPALAHGDVPAATPDAVGILTTWTFQPTIAIPLVAAAAGWLLLVRGIDRAHPVHRVPVLRSVAFMGGLASIAVALLSGLGAYDDVLFSVHMVQHLLLVFVAPPLIALAAPITQLLRAASPRVRNRWLLPILHSRAMSVLGHPVVAWVLFTAVMWISHFSPLFEAALENDFVHEAEHVLFLGSALLFWWPVVGVDPSPHRMSYPAKLMYTFLQMPQNSFLAMALLFVEDPLYPHYVALGSPYGIDPLADQKLAAGIMWFVGDLVFLGALLILLGLWIRREERDTASAERRADAERATLRERADRLAEVRTRAAVSAPEDAAVAAVPAGIPIATPTGAAEPLEAPDQPGIGEASSSR